jgi:hypothetical protein
MKNINTELQKERQINVNMFPDELEIQEFSIDSLKIETGLFDDINFDDMDDNYWY